MYFPLFWSFLWLCHLSYRGEQYTYLYILIKGEILVYKIYEFVTIFDRYRLLVKQVFFSGIQQTWKAGFWYAS